jgi:F-type H+-transporting ATPase subunit gamma
MPSTRDIRRRIRSVKSTAQITKAMQMVASSKMRRAQQAALAGRPYAKQLNRVLAEVVQNAGDYVHPLMQAREVKKTAVILITSDKGLCGALNSNVLREAAKLPTESTVFLAAGRKGSQFIARTRRNLAAEFNYRDTPQFSEARAITRFACDLYLKGEVDRVDVVYTNFINTLVQRPDLKTLIPVGEVVSVQTDIAGDGTTEAVERAGVEFVFEPSADRVFEALLPHYLNFIVFQYLLEARASEHSARMVAMKNATDNAQQLIKSLTLQYNKMRQASITNELLEISSATMSLA